MRDLELWRRLVEEPLSDALALVPLLERLADAPLRDRFPFLGRIEALLAHDDPALRRAAYAVLAGADGYVAFRLLVKGLNDADDGVRDAALEALRASALGHPARWAHAIFHPSAAVREKAILGEQPQGTGLYALHLLTDPACRDSVLARVERGEIAPAPGEALPLVLDLAARDAVPRGLARKLVAASPWHELEKLIDGAEQRDASEVRAVLAARDDPAAIAAAASAGRPDVLDRIFDLLLEPAPGTGPDRAVAAFNDLANGLKSWSDEIADRVLATLFVRFARGRIEEAGAALAILIDPYFLRREWIDRSIRRTAIASLYARAARTRLEDEAMKELVRAPIFRPTGDLLDLYALGGALRLLEGKSPYKRAIHWFSIEAIVASFLDDMEGSFEFFSLDDDSKRGKPYILERIERERPSARATLYALLAIASPPEKLAFLDPINADDAVRIAAEIVRLTARPDAPAYGKRCQLVAEVLGKKIGPAHALDFFRAWLDADEPERIPAGIALLVAIANEMETDAFATTAAALDTERLRKLTRAFAFASTFPYGKEVRLAHLLASHADAAIVAWAAERTPREAAPVEKPPLPGIADLTPSQIDDIVRNPNLPAALEPCFEAPSRGLAAALALRPGDPFSCPEACTALLGSHDRIDLVDDQFKRFGAEWTKVDRFAASAWLHEDNLPLIGNAWLHRWEQHAFAAARELLLEPGFASSLERASKYSTRVLAQQVWDCAASLIGMWRYRDRAQLDAIVTGELGDLLVAKLATDLGEAAARALVILYDSRRYSGLLERLKPAAIEVLPDVAEDVRRELRSWVESRGLPPAIKRDVTTSAEDHALAHVRTLTDLAALEGYCRANNTRFAIEAAMRLIDFGEAGLDHLASAILASPPALLELVPMIGVWPDGPSLSRLRTRAMDPTGAELPYRLAVAFVERGEVHLLGRAIRAAAAPSDPWFENADWEHLRKLGALELDLAIALAPSPHPRAYRRAVERLIKFGADDPDAATALRAFLDQGTERSILLRRSVARWLRARGDLHGYPILLEEHTDPSNKHLAAPVLEGQGDPFVAAAVRAILIGGPRVAPELLAKTLLEAKGIDDRALAAAYESILVDATSNVLRAVAAKELPRHPSRHSKLRAVAETFAWGVLLARELTGRIFTVQMISGKDLGYTRLNENRIHVTPLPLLRREQNGRAIVEGLILHEIGHHIHHRGEIAAESWKEAQNEHIGGLLNLVADEHLERNLRAVDREFGDKLKVLDAYGFQHATRPIHVSYLLSGLLGRAFEALSATRLDVARAEGCVVVQNGQLLHQMEQLGLSFSRFMRALRMGLGNRHDDPLVERGLALFKDGFRHKKMPDLLDIARKLRAIFGWQTRIVERFGAHESLEPDEAGEIIHGDGITSEEIEREVQRVLNPKKRQGDEEESSGSGKPWVNVNPDEAFNPITKIVRMPFDPVEHARYAKPVARDALAMRRFLDDLGLTMEPQRLRMQGRRFDPTRAQAVVIRGDPRMLIARKLEISTDLFIGLAVDCSSSMSARGNIEKAKHFGTLLAEAGRGLPGVDVRAFGFTDHVIFDAGDARFCAVHGLAANGGNNDAAALWHIANVARTSHRKAKLLVMISDGLPTECSVAALRAVVKRCTTRMNMCCAQVAVQPLAEVCFPNYVVLDSADTSASVRQFGKIVAGLVRKAIAIA